MPHLTNPFSAGCPIIELYVTVSAYRQTALIAANQPVPPWQTARAVIDTGASGTCIDPGILKPLNLTPTGTIAIQTPSTSGSTHQCLQYDVMLGIYHSTSSKILGTVPVIATDLASQGIQALIGRDVLSSCLLIYDGIAETFSLAF
jgi:predicted aspartyl protease